MPSLAAAALVLACLSGPLPAQESEVTFRSDSRLVVLHATVMDGQGNLVTSLPQDAFHVFENGVEQEVKIFRREDAPVSLGLIIDDSGSMTNKRERVAAAALAMVRASNPGDEVFVEHFNERTYLDTDFTNDATRLTTALHRFDTNGTTSMRDALRLAIEHISRKAKEDKKVLLVVTDGEDNTSQVGQDYVVKAAQQSGVLIYAVGILNEIPDDKVRKARRELDALAQATGGRSYYLDEVGQADATAREIARIIRNQYTLAYSPTQSDLDGTYRRIRVVVEAPQQLSVITRSGYWATGTASAEARAPR